MGSYIETNDTLRISKQQGFPDELNIDAHLRNPIAFESVKDKIFSFNSKPAIRVYQAPPVRNFLVEDINGKWVYWGLCYILSINHNYITKETSGTFKIIQLNNPEQMKQMFELTHFTDKESTNYFS